MANTRFTLKKAMVSPNFTMVRYGGQVPDADRIEAMRLASAKPKSYTAEMMLDQAGAYLTIPSIVDNLGLDHGQQQEWIKVLEGIFNSARNELAVRKELYQKLLTDLAEPAMRRALAQRAISFYKERMVRKSVEVYTPDQLVKADDQPQLVLSKATPVGGTTPGGYKKVAPGKYVKVGAGKKGSSTKNPFDDFKSPIDTAIQNTLDDKGYITLDQVTSHFGKVGTRGYRDKNKAKLAAKDKLKNMVMEGKVKPADSHGEYVKKSLSKAGEGSRGGKVIGHTADGKPIYASQAGTMSPGQLKTAKMRMKLAAQSAKTEAMKQKMGESQSKRDKAKEAYEQVVAKDPKRKVAELKERIKQTKKRTATIDRKLAREDRQADKSYKKSLSKAEARGGEYHRRIKTEKGYRYIYDPEKYNSRDDAHVDGKETRKGNLKKGLYSCIKAAGQGGCPMESFADLVRKYGKEEVAGMIRNKVSSKELEFKAGRLYLKKIGVA